MKTQRPPSISSGTTPKTKSTVISSTIKLRWLIGIRKKSKKPKRIWIFSSVPKSRKPQSCSIWEKWKSIWSNKRCNFDSIQLRLGSQSSAADLLDGERREEELGWQKARKNVNCSQHPESQASNRTVQPQTEVQEYAWWVHQRSQNRGGKIASEILKFASRLEESAGQGNYELQGTIQDPRGQGLTSENQK